LLVSKYLPSSTVGVLVFGHLLFAASSMAQEDGSEVYSAFASQTTTVNRTSRLQFTIDRWTTDVQRARLIGAIAERGQAAMAEELQKQDPTGTMRIIGGTGAGGRTQFTLRYAREFVNGDQRQLVLATDRYITFGDARRNTTTEDNNLSFIVLELDREQKGEGQMMIGVKMNFVDGKLEVESYAREPIKLLTVKREK